MIRLFNTKLGRLRIIGFLEGLSLLVLIFIAVPMKYVYQDPSLTKILGPIHGAIFILFVLNTISLGLEQKWSFRTRTWKIIAASFIPFGTFYIDRRFLKHLNDGDHQV